MNEDLSEESFTLLCWEILGNISWKFGLNESKIKLKIDNNMNYSMFAKAISPNKYVLILNYDRLKNSPKEDLIGIVAHECGHFEKYKTQNIIDIWLGKIIYRISKKFREKNEKGADVSAIKKGFGKELLSTRLKLENENSYFKKRAEIYLTSEEIKSEIEKLKNDNPRN